VKAGAPNRTAGPALRVAYVTMRFPWPSETFAVTEVRKLIECGVDVMVFPLLPSARLAPEDDWANAQFERRLNGWSLRAYLRGFAAILRAPWTALALLIWIVRTCWGHPGRIARSLVLAPRALYVFSRLRSDPPDVLHLFWGHYPSIVAFLVRRHLSDMVLSTFLGAYDLSMAHEGGYAIARDADCVITQTGANLPDLKRVGVPCDRIHVVNRGLDLGLIDRATDGIRKERGRLVWVGRMVPGKGVLRALEVLRRLLESGEHFTLDVVGDGPDRRPAEMLASGFPAGVVRFHGVLSYHETLRIMARADLLLLLSTKPGERLPNVIKEAMAVRTLAVTWATPGLGGLLVDGAGGRVVRSGDLSGVVEAIRDLSAADYRTRRSRALGRRKIEMEFDAGRSAAQLKSIWLQAIEVLARRHEP